MIKRFNAFVMNRDEHLKTSFGFLFCFQGKKFFCLKAYSLFLRKENVKNKEKKPLFAVSILILDSSEKKT